MANRVGITSWALLLFWTGLILTADIVYAETTWRQHKASAFAQTTGKIAQSALGQGALGRRGLRLRYTYNVLGVNYTGFRYRYDDANVSLRYGRVLDEFQPHTRHTIYYDRNDPRDSVLAPGVDGCDLLLLLVAAPFNVVTFVVWPAFLGYRRTGRPAGEAGGVKILRQNGQVRIRLVEMSPLEAGLYGLGVAAIAEASGVIAACGFDTSMRLMAGMWVVALVAAMAAGMWKLFRNNSGCYDLQLDEAAKTVTLPQAAGRFSSLTIQRDSLVGVTVQRRVSTTPSGRHYSYLPALNFATPETEQCAALVTWGWSEGRALAFGEWLSGQLAAEFQGIQDEKLPTTREFRVPA